MWDARPFHTISRQCEIFSMLAFAWLKHFALALPFCSLHTTFSSAGTRRHHIRILNGISGECRSGLCGRKRTNDTLCSSHWTESAQQVGMVALFWEAVAEAVSADGEKQRRNSYFSAYNCIRKYVQCENTIKHTRSRSYGIAFCFINLFGWVFCFAVTIEWRMEIRCYGFPLNGRTGARGFIEIWCKNTEPVGLQYFATILTVSNVTYSSPASVISGNFFFHRR